MSEELNIITENSPKVNLIANETEKLNDGLKLDFPSSTETKLDSLEDDNIRNLNIENEEENKNEEIKQINHKIEAINGNFMPSAILLERKQINVNESIDSDGNTLLHLAIKYSYLNVIKALIELFHADINYKNNLGETPFHILCSSDKKDLFVSSYFLNLENINFDSKDNNGVTPLFKCIINEYTNMFYSLVYLNCNLNNKDNE